MSELSEPARRWVKVTKHDTNNIPAAPCRGLWVGIAGTGNLVDSQGNETPNFPLKEGLNPLRVLRVKTGGTADDIWALF